MKKQTIRKPTRSSFTVLRQLGNLIPPYLVQAAGEENNDPAKQPYCDFSCHRGNTIALGEGGK